MTWIARKRAVRVKGMTNDSFGYLYKWRDHRFLLWCEMSTIHTNHPIHSPLFERHLHPSMRTVTPSSCEGKYSGCGGVAKESCRLISGCEISLVETIHSPISDFEL